MSIVQSGAPRVRPISVASYAFYCAALFLSGVTIYAVGRWFDETLPLQYFTEEWGPIENLHVSLCGASFAFFGLAWLKSDGAVRVAGGALAMLAAAAFMREIDIKMLATATGPQWLYVLADHGLQEALLIGMTLPIFFYLYTQRQHFFGLVGLATRWQAWPLYVSGVLIILGFSFDEFIVTGERMRFWEELIETHGYIFMLLAAVRHGALVK